MPDRTQTQITDFELEGMLHGLEGEQREARLKLLRQLSDEGVELEVLGEAVKEDRLALLPAEIVLGMDGERFTPSEIASETGLSVDTFQRLIVALGFPRPDPDQRTFGVEDLVAAKRLRRFRDAGLNTDDLIAATRQVGSSAARIAQAHNDVVASQIVDPEANEYEVANSLREASKELLPLAEEAVAYALRAHFLDQLSNEIMVASQPGWFGSGKTTEISVCFADLVGFTRLGERSELERIGTVAKLLEQVAIEVTNPEVRLVKLIGDAAMMVSEDGPPCSMPHCASSRSARRPVTNCLHSGSASPAARQSRRPATGSAGRSTSPAASPRSPAPTACSPTPPRSRPPVTPSATPRPANTSSRV